MKTDKPENPPAFPLFIPADSECAETVHQGLDLRDYFAAQAMQAALSSIETMIAINQSAKETNQDAQTVTAKYAYSFADAMLMERAKS